jgi:hypothetical protein
MDKPSLATCHRLSIDEPSNEGNSRTPNIAVHHFAKLSAPVSKVWRDDVRAGRFGMGASLVEALWVQPMKQSKGKRLATVPIGNFCMELT